MKFSLDRKGDMDSKDRFQRHGDDVLDVGLKGENVDEVKDGGMGEGAEGVDGEGSKKKPGGTKEGAGDTETITVTSQELAKYEGQDLSIVISHFLEDHAGFRLPTTQELMDLRTEEPQRFSERTEGIPNGEEASIVTAGVGGKAYSRYELLKDADGHFTEKGDPKTDSDSKRNSKVKAHDVFIFIKGR